MGRERTREITGLLRKTHHRVIEKAPYVLRPAGAGFAIAAGLDHNLAVFGLSLAVCTGSTLVLGCRKGERNKLKAEDESGTTKKFRLS